MGIVNTLHQELAKIVVRAVEYQVNTPCIKHQLCEYLKADIEGDTYAVGHRKQERVERAENYKGEEDNY